jgi:hypothetical protein
MNRVSALLPEVPASLVADVRARRVFGPYEDARGRTVN